MPLSENSLPFDLSRVDFQTHCQVSLALSCLVLARTAAALRPVEIACSIQLDGTT
jgi:hypothetical protein